MEHSKWPYASNGLMHIFFSSDELFSTFSPEFELSYFQKNGFNWPMMFKTKEKLGMVVPGEDFTITDVRLGVGE